MLISISTLRFRPCRTRQCLNVTIINNKVLETFSVNLQKGVNFYTATLDPSSEVVSIMDDDGTYVLQSCLTGMYQASFINQYIPVRHCFM